MAPRHSSSLSGAVVTMRTKGALWFNMIQAYKGLEHEGAKRRGKTWDPPSFDPIAITVDGN